ncbi:hypothetical protein JMJ35_000084 [Cladonia borealis]|uniref:Uncharacterized protein n=1 Tax=Cladonia borealis TaxID=184061 RepID=A0AA39V7R5_9LECA|nr:hypothetical protein JMJ35_000084 [Cladonia borealis]
MQQTSSMNLSHIDLSESDNLAGETAKLKMFFNLSNPLWTYDTLIFPAFNALVPSSFLGSNTTFAGISISMTLPALRPSLQCIMAPADSITNTANVYHSGDMQIDVDGTLTYGDPGSGVYSNLETVFPWSLDTSNATIAEQLGSASCMTTSQINTPVPDESTARIIMSNESSTPTWFMNTTKQPASPHWFGISLNMFLWALYENSSSANCLGPWFTTLQNGNGGQPLSELLGQANQAELVNSSSQLYARNAVQAMNANMRISVLQLKQNKAPKIVLQVLLGVMAVCSAITYSMLKTKELLRQSPCSIAGKMELLARSELCSTRKVIPEGAEWWDQRQRRQYGLFDGWFFSLCWWGIERKWYGIDIGSAEKLRPGCGQAPFLLGAVPSLGELQGLEITGPHGV